MKFIHILCLLTALFVGSIALTAQTTGSNGFFLHTVTKGQSLYSISRMYNVSVDDIVRLNPGSNEKIRTGETLKIPQATDTNKHAPQYHTIQAGETLYQLTVKYGITAQAICAANPGLSASNFRIGQVIVIPAHSGANQRSGSRYKDYRHSPQHREEKGGLENDAQSATP